MYYGSVLIKKNLERVLLVCASFVAALIVYEAGLQLSLLASETNGYYIWPPHTKTLFTPASEVMPGVSGSSAFLINSQGIRGDEITPSHTYRILAIGGSTTECVYLDQSETWPQLLQTSLNKKISEDSVWVGNVGMSGKTTRHHLTAMQYMPLEELKIDTIILLIGANDFLKRLSREDIYDPHYLTKPKAKQKLIAKTFIGGSPGHSFQEKIALWKHAKNMKAMLSPMELQNRDGGNYTRWRQHRKNASEIRTALPDLSSALDEYTRNINSMIDLADEKSIRLIFMTQPTMWSADLSEDLQELLWLGGVGNYHAENGLPYYSVGALHKGMKAYNNTLLQICKDRDVECLHLAPRLKKDTTVFFDDAHFNESGARKVARALSLYMQKKGFLAMKQQ